MRSKRFFLEFEEIKLYKEDIKKNGKCNVQELQDFIAPSNDK